jgi:hypothetical protein
MKKIIPLCFLLLSCALAAQIPAPESAVSAAESKQPTAIILLDAQPVSGTTNDLSQYADAITTSVSAALAGKGMKILGMRNWTADDRNKPGEPQAAQEAGSTSGANFTVVIRTFIQDQRLFWRIAVYSVSGGTLAGADAYSSFAGLTALPVIDSSARTVASKWKQNFTTVPGADSTVRVSQNFVSRDSGVSVRYGSGPEKATIAAGTVKDGKLEADYLPFKKGEPVYLQISRTGYWPKEMVLPGGVQNKPVVLPRLQKITSSAWGFNTGLGRLLGAGAVYRWYPVPERLFLKTENSFWLSSDFLPGSSIILHDEIRTGLGVYLQGKRDAPFRYAVGTGFSGITTELTNASGHDSPFGFDLTYEPLWFTLEYHFPSWAIVLEERFPYSFGLKTGFLEKGWLGINSMGPLFLSLGVLLK